MLSNSMLLLGLWGYCVAIRIYGYSSPAFLILLLLIPPRRTEQALGLC